MAETKWCRFVGVFVVGGILFMLLVTTEFYTKDTLMMQPYQDGSKKQTKTALERASDNITNHSPLKAEPFYNKTIYSNKTIVFIVAYMRTGSTLTASILQEYPGTFYVFEPVRSVNSVFKQARFKNQTYAHFSYIHQKQIRSYKLSEEKSAILDEINAWSTCRLDNISLHSLMDSFHSRYTKIMKRFSLCFKGRVLPIRDRHVRVPSRRPTKDMCLKLAIRACQRSSMVTLKFIRLSMKNVLELLPRYPNMKIIHLVRDPRGVLNSRLTRHVVRDNFLEHLNTHCTSLDSNLEYSKKIFEKYDNILKIVRYEDMAEDPIGTSREIADFVGIEFLPSMERYVRQQTSSSRDSCAYCTQRKNSNSTANKWRTQLDPKRADEIYTTCKSSNGILGYLPLNNRTIGDLNVPSHKSVDVFKKLYKHRFPGQ